MAGWVRGPSLGENKLAALCNAQQVFLSLMEYDDFTSPLHEVGRGDPLALRTRPRCCGRLVSGSWCLCHASLHLLLQGYTARSACLELALAAVMCIVQYGYQNYDNDFHYRKWQRLCKPTYKRTSRDVVCPATVPYSEHTWKAGW